VDPEGARALADRIKSGPPREESEERPAGAGAVPPKGTPFPASKPAKSRGARSLDEVVYIKPRPVTRPDVRIYVRGQDGHLERANS